MEFRSQEYALGWLAGIIDGEGTVTPADEFGAKRRMQIVNTDLEILRGVEEVLQSLGIKYSRYIRPQSNPRWKPITSISFHGRIGFRKLNAAIQLRQTQKADALTTMDAGYKPVADPLDRDELERLYRVERLSQTAIAERLGVKPARIQYNIEKYGLQITPKEKLERSWRKRSRPQHSEKMRAYWAARRAREAEEETTGT